MMELKKKPQHYIDVKFRGILIFRIRFCLLSLCISFCCDWKFEIYIWDTWSFSNVYRLGFRSEMLLWRLFRTVLSIPHLDYRKSCLLSTLSPLLLSSNVCILVLNRFWEISQTVSNGGRRCLSQFWFVFSLEENDITLFETRVVQLSTIESRFNSFTLTNSAWNVFPPLPNDSRQYEGSSWWSASVNKESLYLWS